MLKSIKIINFALISKSQVEFEEGFNVLTGETGAGKSLIVDALVFLTGVRADKTFIKYGEDFSRVEGVFVVEADNHDINSILNSVGLYNEGTLIISRQFNLNGKNECRINGEIVTLNIIRKLSSHLIDIFGQNDGQILLDNKQHLSLIDDFFSNELSDVKHLLKEEITSLDNINQSIKDLGGLDKDRENNIDLIKYQISEIDSANLYEGLEEEIKSQIVAMQNIEKITSAVDVVRDSLNGDYSIDSVIKTSINSLSSIENYVDNVSILKDRLYSVRYEMQDILAEIENITNGLNYDENSLDVLEDRMIVIKDLERKYGSTIADILKCRQDLAQKLEMLLNADEELERLSLNKKNTLNNIYRLCCQLRELRVMGVAKVKTQLEEELKSLGMKNAQFDVVFKNELLLQNMEGEATENGADDIEFMFSANLGVEPRPLVQIISGGELSRFMLAFKSIQNSNTSKTCIFDEIDTGIGGEIGSVVGQKICKISGTNQVVCITHLAQIASYGDVNFKIEKFDQDNKTFTSVRCLNAVEKEEEIARMLSGNLSTNSINHAKELIDSAHGFKAYLTK